jgi:hypothetical protein
LLFITFLLCLFIVIVPPVTKAYGILCIAFLAISSTINELSDKVFVVARNKASDSSNGVSNFSDL